MDSVDHVTQSDSMISHFGMRVEEAGDGRARVSVDVGENALNQHGVAHGALVFALADVAFALAVNSLADAMGVQWSFNILRSTRPGQTLTAECSTVHRGSRLFVVEYTVVDDRGKLVAQGQATALPVENVTRVPTTPAAGSDGPAGG